MGEGVSNLEFFRIEAGSDRVDETVASLRSQGWLVRVVRGERMGSTRDVQYEFATAFQFPQYFHPNCHSFDELIADLSWLTVDKGVPLWSRMQIWCLIVKAKPWLILSDL